MHVHCQRLPGSLSPVPPVPQSPLLRCRSGATVVSDRRRTAIWGGGKNSNGAVGTLAKGSYLFPSRLFLVVQECVLFLCHIKPSWVPATWFFCFGERLVWANGMALAVPGLRACPANQHVEISQSFHGNSYDQQLSSIRIPKSHLVRFGIGSIMQ